GHALGDVAGDLGEAEHGPGGIVKRLDERARPEPAAVLAKAPALAFAAPGVLGLPENARRNAGGLVLGGEETGGMPTDDLGGDLALRSSRAGIPVRDEPVGVEPVGRVVSLVVD